MQTSKDRRYKAIVLRDVDMIDMRNTGLVEINVSHDRSKLWVNVDGKCRLRVYGLRDLIVEAEGKPVYTLRPDATEKVTQRSGGKGKPT